MKIRSNNLSVTNDVIPLVMEKKKLFDCIVDTINFHYNNLYDNQSKM